MSDSAASRCKSLPAFAPHTAVNVEYLRGNAMGEGLESADALGKWGFFPSGGQAHHDQLPVGNVRYCNSYYQ